MMSDTLALTLALVRLAATLAVHATGIAHTTGRVAWGLLRAS
jgi:uncharacterized membrane protein YecN with MAPEG domain